MRLLQIRGNDELTITDDLIRNIPPYAVLSHTWGPWSDEVTFQDLIDGTGKYIPGYQKILFCMQQAKRDGLDYFWVDTCCIDKTSSAELSEAINSMFRWYQKAVHCYVHLSDVSIEADLGLASWESQFRKSRWFTRGWTLQELIAPASVRFYSRGGTLLGDKTTLEDVIHEITGLPIPVLRGHRLSDFSIEKRLSWSKDRHTTRHEDIAYCQLGILDVSMAVNYGEGEESAFRRLRREIEWTKNFDWPEYKASSPSSNTGETLRITIDTESENSELEEIESIFSSSRLSMSSKSSVELNPIRVSGIREIARVLLNHEDFISLCTAAITDIPPGKSRAHIRGFLKSYGQQLDTEANSPLEHQAARFVREVAGKIADELRWSITGFNEARALDPTGEEKPDLEKWLSTVEPGWNSDTNLPPAGDDGSDGDKSEDNPDFDARFPNIGAVKEFLLSSNAFETLLQALDNWTNVKTRSIRPTRQRTGPAPDSNVMMNLNDDVIPTDATAPVASDKLEKSLPHDSTTNSSSHPAGRPENFRSLISGLLDFWGVSFIFYDILELFVPPVPTGFERIRWRCSCDTILWGDFPLNDSDALAKLKEDLSINLSLTRGNSKAGPAKDRSTQQSSDLSGETTSTGGRPSRSDTTSQVLATSNSAVSFSLNDGQSDYRLGVAPGPSASSHLYGEQLVGLTGVTVDKINPIYFEVCTNIGNSAVRHFELDITQTATDGELFEKIWDIYNQSRGFGPRRLFLRPRDVHFVLFSVSSRQSTRYSAGIHEKPKEYPPDAELQGRRYHYQTPKIMMPPHIFIHFLHRARWNVWGDHADDTWLKRLPKKLNDGILAAQATEASQDLVFGWGVHILDGPNHAVLGLFLSFGLMITFVISCLIVGIAKTQEQAFGVGQYLIAIIVAFMSAMYFKLQDQ